MASSLIVREKFGQRYIDIQGREPYEDGDRD